MKTNLFFDPYESYIKSLEFRIDKLEEMVQLMNHFFQTYISNLESRQNSILNLMEVNGNAEVKKLIDIRSI